jgi:mycofactocin system glycosyltransferase
MSRVLPPLPVGFQIELDAGTREIAPGTLCRGVPTRVLRLTDVGRATWTELRSGAVNTLAGGALARRLTDAGVAHPVPPATSRRLDLTVVVPVLDRADDLEQCLAAMGNEYAVVVVDDGSTRAAAVADVVRRHGATLVRRPDNGGPAAARNLGLSHCRSEFVAFVDSDCLPQPGWIDRLARHFEDPAVAAVAPRVRPHAGRSWSGRYTRARCGLDLGAAPARILPGGRVGYVPTAALLVRRAALADIARQGEVFDETMRVGEDVDVIWRLYDAGWRMRYDPSVEVRHIEPADWPSLLRRRARYGTSAAPLARRHPAHLAAFVATPWPALAMTGVFAGRPTLAAAGCVGTYLSTATNVRRAGVPGDQIAPAVARTLTATSVGVGHAAAQLALPAVLAAALPGRRRARRRVAVAALMFGACIHAWRARVRDDEGIDALRFGGGWLADEAAYGFGVWAGCVRGRDFTALRPRLAPIPRPAHRSTPR